MQGISEQHEAPSHTVRPTTAPTSPRGSSVTRIIVLLFTIVLVVVAVVWGISSRHQADAQLTVETAELAIPTVSVLHPKTGTPQQEIVLPGNMQPYIDAPIYARTNGYLKAWHADIGARVKAGQLLAEIDAPEIDSQLQQAQADLQSAEANSQLANITAQRYVDLLKTDSVSKQDADNATGALQARKAAVDSARANVKRLQDLQSFQKIYAPFDGVITARNTDIGALIDSGAGGVSRELFHIAALDKLRVYVNVPEVYTPAIKAGIRASLTLAEFPGRHFEGMLVRNADSIDANTRTLLTEVDVENHSGELKPGGYVEVHLNLPSPATTFTLPVNAVIFKSAGMQIATVKDGKTVHLLSINPGRDFGNEIEVLSGLKGDESVIVNPPDYLTEGQKVRVASSVSPDKGQS